MGSKQSRTAGAARQQVASLCSPTYEIVVPFSSTDSETRKRSIENWFCLEHIPRRSRFCYRKTATVLLPFCGTIFYKMSQTSPYNCTPTCAGFASRYVPFFAVGGGAVARGCSVAESRDCQLSGRAEEVRHTHCMRSVSLQSRHGNSSKRYVLEHRHAINIAKEHFQCTRRMGTLSDIARVREIDTASR